MWAKWLERLLEFGTNINPTPAQRHFLALTCPSPPPLPRSRIWIIDSKDYQGKVGQRDVGEWLKTDRRLYDCGRDHTELVRGFARQIHAVLEATGNAEIPINATAVPPGVPAS
jgi:hypothetical protein